MKRTKLVSENKKSNWDFVDYIKEEDQQRENIFYMGMTSLVLGR